MKITLRCKGNTAEFVDKQVITIGSTPEYDFVVEGLASDSGLKLIYAQKYKNYVLVNVASNENILCNKAKFSKILLPADCSVTLPNQTVLYFESENLEQKSTVAVKENKVEMNMNNMKNDDIFNCETEHNRVRIIKEIGYKIQNLQNSLNSSKKISAFLNVAIVILSVISSFGITNFLLGFKIENSSSTLNLTTNVGFLTCIAVIIAAVSFILRQSVCSKMMYDQTKRIGDSDFVQKSIIGITVIFMFVIYVLNLFYYSSIPGFEFASIFVAFLFVGSLLGVSVAGGYCQSQIRLNTTLLNNCEYREDFEAVMKNYRMLINLYINKLSQNRLNTVKSNLVNNQLKMVLETFIGILTAPFLAYGVSNTLAGCFPEAANWVRISGLRFSPIFLVLATFLIIFAFFSFVRAFTISKQMKASQIIKIDGFHDYNSHGVTVYGLDSMKNLAKEKNIVMYIACFIILIEFTMNVSYFITEIGGDIQGIFLSIVTALVPTALLIAETHMLSETMFKINSYNDLLAALD